MKCCIFPRPPHSGISDHDIVVVDMKLTAKLIKPPKRKIFLYKKAEFNEISELINEFDRSLTEEHLQASDVNSLWDNFQTTLQAAIDKYVPSKLSSTRYNSPWIDQSIRRDIRRKQRLYNKARKSGSSKDWENFKSLRRLIRKAHNQYVNNVIGESLKSDNTKPFWKFIKSTRQEVFGISSLSTGGRRVSCARDKAQALNQQFPSVFTKENLEEFPVLDHHDMPDLPKLTITVAGVQKLLEDLQPNKTTGPDQIPAKILKSCASSLAPVLQKIFQKSVNTGVLPKGWLKANVVPIYKKGERTNPENYRPVSLTSIPCKILEHIIFRHIKDHLDIHDVITHHQHGFRKGRSCETQLAGLINDLAKTLDNRSQADLVILDFSKAFDKVPHRRLLRKLEHVGINNINNSLLHWLSMFLTDRHQRVLLEGAESQESPVTSGVPQGTVLGPLIVVSHLHK